MLCGNDKAYHFIAGLIVCILVSLIFKNPMYGLIASVIAGIGKEIYDYYDYGKFDFADALATFVGGICGYIVGVLIKAL